ncbi:ABC transporter ATP-binding protein [Bradyrhizobium sp. Arg237L]|uniref:ABC transporter ATP-binding protein n=1 Tax=Bradyrhizobium sp. Arg237L TaxID=3003352 RepID=UPI00249E9695|nr:ABC transporter ATP-binding protein [Bradyrhizobium sp. Arg237L]MDI4238305.1 ABC transporter ATP-binding protein [Bradyrhizobium sp. Arg237L]
MTAPVLLEVNHVRRQFGGTVAVSDVSLQIKRGARHGVIGPNGAGKTTLFNLISGWTAADSGTILLDGEPIHQLSAEQVVRRGLARTFQYAQLCATMTVLANIVLALQGQQRLIYSFFRPIAAYAGLVQTAKGILADVGLGQYADTQVSALSYGAQKQVEVAMVLATRPAVLLLDEPTAGLSPAESSSMLQLLRSLDPEITILIIEHDMDVLFGLADTITVLNAGEVLSEGSAAEIRADPLVRQAYMGSRALGRAS